MAVPEAKSGSSIFYGKDVPLKTDTACLVAYFVDFDLARTFTRSSEFVSLNVISLCFCRFLCCFGSGCVKYSSETRSNLVILLPFSGFSFTYFQFKQFLTVLQSFKSCRETQRSLRHNRVCILLLHLSLLPGIITFCVKSLIHFALLFHFVIVILFSNTMMLQQLSVDLDCGMNKRTTVSNINM